MLNYVFNPVLLRRARIAVLYFGSLMAAGLLSSWLTGTGLQVVADPPDIAAIIVPTAGASGAVENCGGPPATPCPDASADETSREAYEAQRTATVAPTPVAVPVPTQEPVVIDITITLPVTPEPTPPPQRDTLDKHTDAGMTAYYPDGGIAYQSTVTQAEVRENGTPRDPAPMTVSVSVPDYEAARIAVAAAALCNPIATPSVCKELAIVADLIVESVLGQAAVPTPEAVAPVVSQGANGGSGISGNPLAKAWMDDCREDVTCRARWSEYGSAISRAATRWDVPATLLLGVAWQEGRFHPGAVGDDGKALGMFQLNTNWHPLPQYGIDFLPFDFEWASNYAARWLADLAADRDGDWCAAIDAYQGRQRSDPLNYADEIWTCSAVPPAG